MQDILKKLAGIKGEGTPILAETFLYLPSELSAALDDDADFAVAYFYDIEYLLHIVELVCHKGLLPGNLEKIAALLRDAGFAPYALQESRGFIYNRLGCVGILGLFLLYDRQVLSYDNLGKYLFSTRAGAATVNINLAVEIRNDLFDFVPLFRALRETFGPRFYQPRFLSRHFTRDTFEQAIAETSAAYSPGPAGESGAAFDPGRVKSVYVVGSELVYNNILYPLLRKKVTLYFDTFGADYFDRLQGYDPRLRALLMGEGRLIEAKLEPEIDLVMDFTLEPLPETIARVRGLQNRFGPKTPILLNTPIYKIESIAAEVPYPAMVFGMYTQKNYLLNTELVITSSMDRGVYAGLRDFIKNLATDCIETADAPVRPLVFMLILKMLEAVRILEEGAADMETIEAAGVDRPVFKEMDLFGLDKIAFICAYLEPIFPGFFEIPATINDMIKENRLGYATGRGFYRYD